MDGEISEEYAEIASDYDDEAAPVRVTPGAPQRRRLSKPNKGTRFLVVLLQALVMAAALFLFFLFAGIAAVLLLHLFVAGRSLRRHRRRLGGAGGPRVGGLSQEELRRLPSCRYSGKGRGESADCVVCLEGVRPGERWRVLPACGHGFHKACVDRWLVRAPACPVCRAGVRAG